MTIQEFIKKLQALSEKQKIAIIAVVVVIATLVMGYFWIIDTMQSISQIGTAVKSEQLPNIDLNSIAGTTSPSDQPATTDDSIAGTTSPSDQSATVDTSSWQTYTNSQYGFEFQYPSGVTVINQGKDTVGIDDTRYGYSFGWDLMLYKNEGSNNLKDWIVSEFNGFMGASDKDCKIFNSGQSYNDGRADVQGAKATLVIDTSDFNQTCTDEGYYIMSPNKLTVIKFDGIDQSSEELTSFLFSTFKFTN